MAKEKSKKKEEVNNDTDDSKTVEQDIDLTNFNDIAKLIYDSENINDTKPKIISAINGLIKQSPVSSKYKIIFLYDPVGDIVPYTADRIYSALPKEANQDILRSFIVPVAALNLLT